MTYSAPITIWICMILILCVIGLTMLTADVLRRRRQGLSLRFYWQAMVLLLASTAVGCVKALTVHVHVDYLSLTLSSIALIYLIISISQVTRRVPDAKDAPPLAEPEPEKYQKK